MKALPLRLIASGYEPCSPTEATHIQLEFPGPIPTRILPIRGPRGWTWNGDVEKPTLQPSILTSNGEAGDRCHSFVEEGRVRFLSDCSHEFAGRTVDLLDVD